MFDAIADVMAKEARIPQSRVFELLEADRLQTVSLVAREILGQIRNPLNLIRGRAETLRGQVEHFQRDNVQGILDQVNQLESVVDALENFLQPRSGKIGAISVWSLVEEIVSFFQFRIDASRVQLMNLLPPELQLHISATALRQVLTAIIINAMEALDDKGTGIKTVFVQYQFAENKHILSVEDNALGLTGDALKLLFVPFESSKKNHVGLSLAICKQICQSQGWELKAFSQVGRGTRLEVCIPVETFQSP